MAKSQKQAEQFMVFTHQDTGQAVENQELHSVNVFLTCFGMQMAKLQEQAESFTRKIEGERRKIEELDGNIKELNAAVLEQRKKLGGSNVVRDNNLKTQKQIKVLENRLDKSLLKFNEALAFNKQLRVSPAKVQLCSASCLCGVEEALGLRHNLKRALQVLVLQGQMNSETVEP